ncbi:hypothetical protein [Inquilinus sp. Marseille-Q2685]|uniref:hypothetical protein n=1 Tax=Inquilinus sp. Marseille-Q2685 TaxID=2866581 RepID=UPI001CE47FCD|nr:hypothetical protein [Inquilinus sp. Marseille-Q2685]
MGIEFVRPWAPVSEGKVAVALQRRLEFEVTPPHPLWGRQARVIGRSDANDDVVVAMPDGGFAIVHLVWGASPGDVRWPATSFFSSAEEISRAMAEWSREAGYLDEK